MLSADEVVDQIQHGQVPDHWHIVKGHSSPLKAVLQTLAACLLSWLIGVCLYYAIQGKVPTFDPYAEGIWAIFCVIIPSFRAWRKGREAQQSLLIMEPEGFMLLTHYNGPSKRILMTYFYGYIVDIDLKLRYPLNFTKNPALRMNISTANGIPMEVDIDTRFGSPLKTAQTIIMAHAQYRVLMPMPHKFIAPPMSYRLL